MTATTDHAYTDIRDAVRALCAEFPDAYHREVDSRRAYPEAFVDALTKAGWMAALIPQEYGGSGLGLGEHVATVRAFQQQPARFGTVDRAVVDDDDVPDFPGQGVSLCAVGLSTLTSQNFSSSVSICRYSG